MRLVDALAGLVMLPVWVGALFQLFGLPVAWLRVRKTAAWTERPPELRRITLLAAYMRPVTALAVVGALIAGLFLILFTVVFHPGPSETAGVVYGTLLVGVPLVLAPWAVARLDPAGLPELDEYRIAEAPPA